MFYSHEDLVRVVLASVRGVARLKFWSCFCAGATRGEVSLRANQVRQNFIQYYINFHVHVVLVRQARLVRFDPQLLMDVRPRMVPGRLIRLQYEATPLEGPEFGRRARQPAFFFK